MWIRENELYQLGFRQRSEGYWKCERKFGQGDASYLSIFAYAVEWQAGQRGLEVSAFHVTFPVGQDNLHFYYHERGDQLWEPGGHTSGREIQRYKLSLRRLRDRADEVAQRLIQAWAGKYLERSAY